MVIELDGMTYVGRREEDEERTRFLQMQKLRVIRFINDELLADRDAVAAAILIEAMKT